MTLYLIQARPATSGSDKEYAINPDNIDYIEHLTSYRRIKLASSTIYTSMTIAELAQVFDVANIPPAA